MPDFHTGFFIDEYVLAQALDLSVETIRRLTRESKLPYNTTDSGFLYNLEEVITALTKTNPELLKSKPIDFSKKYSCQDYLEIPPHTEGSYEVLDGQLIREPGHSVVHQRTCRRLMRVLEDYFQTIDPQGEVFSSPLDTSIHGTTVAHPDILYISGRQKEIIKGTCIEGAPTLVVEITSPSTHIMDSVTKLHLYLKAGVVHYWLVDPEAKSFRCYAMEGDRYSLTAQGNGDEVLVHPDFAGLSVDLGSLWKNV